MICDGCQDDVKHVVGAIIDGVYGQHCYGCIDKVKRQHSAGSAAYSRARDREMHEVDLLQPWNNDAKRTPNKKFIEHYPDEAKDMFTKEELDKFG